MDRFQTEATVVLAGQFVLDAPRAEVPLATQFQNPRLFLRKDLLLRAVLRPPALGD